MLARAAGRLNERVGLAFEDVAFRRGVTDAQDQLVQSDFRGRGGGRQLGNL